MVETLEVRLPIADVLVVQPVDHMFSQQEVRQERVGTAVEEAGRDQISLMDCCASVTTADCGQDLIAQPTKVRLQLRQHVCRGEVSRQRLMGVKQIARIFLHDDVDRVEQTLNVPLHDERSTDIGHDEIADEKHAQIGQMNEKSVVCFSAVDGDQLDARSTDF